MGPAKRAGCELVLQYLGGGAKQALGSNFAYYDIGMQSSDHSVLDEVPIVDFKPDDQITNQIKSNV